MAASSLPDSLPIDPPHALEDDSANFVELDICVSAEIPGKNSGVVTMLFTDIEGSARLWEQEPERMRAALACHDAITRAAVEGHRGVVVKMRGDGVHAAFEDPLDAICATLQLQQAVANPEATCGIAFQVRCGLHAGVIEHRDDDFFGGTVNRAARITGVAHGGQALLSQAVAVLIGDRLPADVALRDLGSVRLRDLATPEHVYQVVHSQLRQNFPALRALEVTPNNLPRQVTSFVGRSVELAEVRTLLGKTRLLTLLGVGGIGKTRLSLQVATETLDDYPDGVWFVELAPLTDARLVPQAVASVLGVKEQVGHPVIEALIQHVKDRTLLLILDNCEHLVRACAELAMQLLQAGLHAKILTSSRESLHVRGETTYSVPAFAVPDASHPATLEDLPQYEAVGLFVDRAVAVQPQFRLTERNAASVAQICQRLDGIPLAIELAAARLSALSVETINTRLDHRFRLLVGGDRTALRRQQTLRALIDWSYDLLIEEERVLFRRLAVFAGGWTLEAAVAVGADVAIAQDEVLNLLTDLVDKSLVAASMERDGYRLLETVREYAQERLVAAGEEDATRTRHLIFFVNLAETARPELNGPHQATWLARLDLDRENLLAAHEWSGRKDSGNDMGLRLVTAMKQYFQIRGLLGLGQRVMAEALTRTGAQRRDAMRSRALCGVGQICCLMGRYQEALVYLDESLAIAREIGDPAREAAVLQPLGMALAGQGDLPGARKYSDEAVVLARRLGNKREIAAALNNRAQLHRVQGEIDVAQSIFEQVLNLTRDVGDDEFIAIALLNLAMLEIGRGAGDRACEMLLEVIAIATKLGSKPANQSVLEASAGLAAARGQWERAARFFGAAETHARQTGFQRDLADEVFLASLMQKSRAMSPGEQFDAAMEAGGRLSPEVALAEARTWLANWAREPQPRSAS